MPLADPLKGWELPGGPAAMRRVTLRWDQGGWEFFSDRAAKIQALGGGKRLWFDRRERWPHDRQGDF